MKFIDIIKRANRNLFKSKLRTFLTITAIVIGSFTVSLTTALGEGVKQSVDVQMQSISAKNVLVVYSGANSASFENPAGDTPTEYNPEKIAGQNMVMLTPEDIKKIEKAKNIESVHPMYNMSALYITNDKTDKQYEIYLLGAMPGVDISIIEGERPLDDEDNFIILTHKYVKGLGYKSGKEALGEKVTVTYQNPFGEELNREYTIKALISNSFINNGASYVSVKESEFVSNFQTKDTPLFEKYFAALAVIDKDAAIEKVEESKKDLEKQGFVAQTVEDQTSMIKGVVSAIQLVIGIFGLMTILASVFGIVNTLLMGVYERTQEIGLMKALGMKKSTVFMMFSMEAASIGFWGGFIGSVLAYFVGQTLNNIIMDMNLLGFEGQDFFVFPLQYMVIIIALLTLVGLLAGALPSRKASNMDPIQALRYE